MVALQWASVRSQRHPGAEWPPSSGGGMGTGKVAQAGVAVEVGMICPQPQGGASRDRLGGHAGRLQTSDLGCPTSPGARRAHQVLLSELSVCLSGGPCLSFFLPLPSPASSVLSHWLQLSTRRPHSPRLGSCLSCSPCVPMASVMSLASCSTPTPRESLLLHCSWSCPCAHTHGHAHMYTCMHTCLHACTHMHMCTACLFSHWQHPPGEGTEARII